MEGLIDKDNLLLSEVLDQNSSILSLLHINEIFYLKDFLETNPETLPDQLKFVQKIFKDVYLNLTYEIDDKFFNKIYFPKEMKSQKTIVTIINEIADLLRSIGLSDDEIIDMIHEFVKMNTNITLFDFIASNNISYLKNYKLVLLDYYLKRENLKTRREKLLTQDAGLLRVNDINFLLSKNIINYDMFLSNYTSINEDYDENSNSFMNEAYKILSYYCDKKILEISKDIFNKKAYVSNLLELGFDNLQIDIITKNIEDLSKFSILELLKMLSFTDLPLGISFMARVLINYYDDNYTLRRIK